MKGRDSWVVCMLHWELNSCANHWANRFSGKRTELEDRKSGFGKRGLGLPVK